MVLPITHSDENRNYYNNSVRPTSLMPACTMMIVGAHGCAGSHQPPNERKLSALQQTSKLTNKAHENQQPPAGLYARIETAAHGQKRT